jgi:exopolysaccharide biosynthesis polyprenyl glycosylphosphotransferase
MFRRCLAIADALAVVAALGTTMTVTGESPTVAITIIPLAFILLAKAIGLYDRDQHLLHHTTLDEVPALFGMATLSTLLVWFASGWMTDEPLGRPPVLLAWGLLFVFLIGARALARPIARHYSPVERCLFVGAESDAEELREKLALSPAVKAELVGWIPVIGRRDVDDPGTVAELPSKIATATSESQIERIVVGPGVPDHLLDEIRQLRGGVKVSLLPELRRVVTSAVELDWLNGIALVGLPPFALTASSQFIKRSFDVVGSISALTLAAPVMGLAAVAIRLETSGPVLFRQQRAGRHGDAFSMLKFRSMVEGAEGLQPALLHLNEADGVFKITDDPRITRVGRFIRRTHIDELPQLVNVLRGHMSLVGPRPLPLEEDRQIEGWHRRRLELRPGITGPWQVLGSARVPVREMVKLDYQYVANWSLWNDFRLLILTAGRVLRRSGV